MADKSLDEISRSIAALSEGDLSTEVSDDFEGVYGRIAADLNSSMASLSAIISQIGASGEAANATAEELSEGARNLSIRTERNAATLEETSAALAQLEASIRSTANAAGDAGDKTATAVGDTRNGIEIVERTISSMQDIKESSDAITKITDLIDNIAFQTNLLALNAGVEAARAGDAGRGFAVVATEVRDLAARSSDAAKEISELILASSNRSERRGRTGRQQRRSSEIHRQGGERRCLPD